MMRQLSTGSPLVFVPLATPLMNTFVNAGKTSITDWQNLAQNGSRLEWIVIPILMSLGEWIPICTLSAILQKATPKRKQLKREDASRDSVNISRPIERENLKQAAVDERPSLALREVGASDINRKAASGKRDSVGTRKEPYLTTVLVNENLNHPFSTKETRHVVIAMKNDKVNYKVGDALGVIPRNCPDLVRRVLLALGMDRDIAAEYQNEWYPLRDILMYKLDLTTIDRRLIKVMAPFDSTGLCTSLLNDRSMASEYIRKIILIDFVQHANGTHMKQVPLWTPYGPWRLALLDCIKPELLPWRGTLNCRCASLRA